MVPGERDFAVLVEAVAAEPPASRSLEESATGGADQ